MAPPRSHLVAIRNRIPILMGYAKSHRLTRDLWTHLRSNGQWIYESELWPRMGELSGRVLVAARPPQKVRRLAAAASDKVRTRVRPYGAKAEEMCCRALEMNARFMAPVTRLLPTPAKKRISSRKLTPVLSEQELSTLRNKLNELANRWEADVKVAAASAVKGEGNQKKVPKKEVGESTPKSEEALTKSSIFTEKWKEVGKYVSPLPSYISNTAKELISSKKSNLNGEKSNSNGEKSNGKNGSSPSARSSSDSSPPWKLRLGSTANLASFVDARTRSCVRELKLSDPDRCLRQLEVFCTHLHQHPWGKGAAVRDCAVGILLLIRARTNNPAVKVQATEALELVGFQEPLRTRGIRILCLDGGGMRGVVALEVLRQLEVGTGKRIHELFDMICGVSTGSIIAAFLAFHKKPVDNVEEIYRHLGQKIFTRNVLRGTTGWLTTHSYYDSEIYETILKSFVGETAMSDTVRAAHTPKVAIVSTLVSEEQICPYVFRNYHYPYRSQSFYRGSARHPIWAAVRASSAAPGYFDEFALAGKIHHDGGMMCNNATLIAVHEAQRLWPNDSLQCVVSLGMGRHQNPIPPQDVGAGEETPKALSLAKKFARVVDAATDTEIPHVALHDLLPGSVYYRFNPVLSEYFPLDVANLDKMAKMREDTQMYLRRNRHRVREACDQLSLERRPWDTARDYANIGAEIALAKVTNRDLLS